MPYIAGLSMLIALYAAVPKWYPPLVALLEALRP